MKKTKHISFTLLIIAFGLLTFFGLYNSSAVSDFSKPQNADLFEMPENFYGNTPTVTDCTLNEPVTINKKAVIHNEKVERVKQVNIKLCKNNSNNKVESSLKNSPTNASINLFIEEYQIINNSDSVERPFLFTYDSYNAVLKKIKDVKEPAIIIEDKEGFSSSIISTSKDKTEDNIHCRNISLKEMNGLFTN